MEHRNLKTSITGYVQAVVAILSCLGVSFSPENSEGIVSGTIVIIGVLSAIKGYFTKDK